MPSVPVGRPLPAVKPYVSENYGVAFEPPPGLTYCPLPANWVGSDHGTDLFLTPPSDCGGAGFPSSGRAYDPDVPRIFLYYGWALDEGEGVRKCDGRPLNGLRLFGHLAKGCRTDKGEIVSIEIRAMHQALGNPVEVSLTLGTTHARLQHDFAIFKQLAAATKACKPDWATSSSPAPSCPKGAGWY